MTLELNNIFSCCCNFKDRLRVEYNRELDKILLLPCCGTVPKIMEEPFVFDSNFFLENYDQCIERYSKIDMPNLNEYYSGTCCAKYGTDRLCSRKYQYNKRINSIENAISKNCNLNCKMCIFKRDYNKKELDIYNKLNEIVCYKNYDTIMLTTNGEPFLDKKHTMNFIQRTNAKRIIILTNSQLLDRTDLDFLKEISKIKAIVLIFSIDSINKETYEKIRIGASYEKMMDNLIYAKNIGLLDHINYTIQEDNYLEIDKALEFFKSLNINFDFCVDYKSMKDKPDIVNKHINDIAKYLVRYENKYK